MAAKKVDQRANSNLFFVSFFDFLANLCYINIAFEREIIMLKQLTTTTYTTKNKSIYSIGCFNIALIKKCKVYYNQQQTFLKTMIQDTIIKSYFKESYHMVEDNK